MRARERDKERNNNRTNKKNHLIWTSWLHAWIAHAFLFHPFFLFVVCLFLVIISLFVRDFFFWSNGNLSLNETLTETSASTVTRLMMIGYFDVYKRQTSTLSITMHIIQITLFFFSFCFVFCAIYRTSISRCVCRWIVESNEGRTRHR